MGGVTTAEQPEPRVEIVPPDEALRRARPLPCPKDLVIHDVTDEEWAAFHQALAER
jgi:hypothetical protein